MHYLLDTNIFIAALKAQPAVRLRLESLPASALVLSPIVLGELKSSIFAVRLLSRKMVVFTSG